MLSKTSTPSVPTLVGVVSFLVTVNLVDDARGQAKTTPRPLTAAEARRLDALGHSPKLPPKKLKEYRERFTNKWVNPAAGADWVVQESGDCAEIKPNGRVHAKGVWRVTGESSAVAALDNEWNIRMRLVSDEVMAFQPVARDGTLSGDGGVRFRVGYDWKPGTTGVALGPQVRAGRIVGRWTHPEFPHYWNVAPDGSWKEQHKEGGLEHLGAMHAMDDGGFIVVFGNGFRLRCWPVDENLLAIIVVDPFGKMVSDGLLAERSAN